jgi:sulfur-oxidizing protein SoxY
VNSIHRRTFLKNTLGVSVLALAATAGLLKPARAWAAEWPKGAFESKKLEEAIKALYGSADMSESAAVKIKAPAQAENSTQVQFQVMTDLPNVEQIAVFVEKNPNPLVAQASFAGAVGYFSARMKMGQTSDVYAVVKAGGKLHMAKTNIKVTAGGCGG